MKIINRNILVLLTVSILLLGGVPSEALAIDNGIAPLSVSMSGSTLSKSGQTLSVFAYTQSYIIEDTISVTSTLQFKSGSSWVDLYTWPTATGSKTSYISLSKTYAATSGVTYRVKSTHYTKTGTTTDTKISYSTEVTVS